MADQGQRTEQPTPRRLEKARQDGRFPSSKEFVGGVTFAAFVWILTHHGGESVQSLHITFRYMLNAAFRSELNAGDVSRLLNLGIRLVLWPAVLWGLGLVVVAVGSQLLMSGLGVAPGKLAPDFSRLAPGNRLSQLPKQNLASAAHAVLMLPIFVWVTYLVVRDNLPRYLRLPTVSLAHEIQVVSSSLSELLVYAAAALFILGAFDMFRQKRRWMNEMRMTKQEVKEEQKEAEGSPLMKMRIRRLQREVARRRMMQQVPDATAVVVNPTHYAVAIRYKLGEPGAPKVVAKGKNLLALRIREIAAKNQVPVVENPPLARALYGSAEVGQEIPAHLYQAVAEVLAYIYRLLNGHPAGRR